MYSLRNFRSPVVLKKRGKVNIGFLYYYYFLDTAPIHLPETVAFENYNDSLQYYYCCERDRMYISSRFVSFFFLLLLVPVSFLLNLFTFTLLIRSTQSHEIFQEMLPRITKSPSSSVCRKMYTNRRKSKTTL